MATAYVRGIALHYERYGARGPVLLLVHGLGSSARDWEHQVEALAADHQVIAVDLRGHGQTSREGPISIPGFAADLSELLTSLQISSAYVIGISMGSAIALELAAEHAQQVAGIIVINGGVEGPSSAEPAQAREIEARFTAVRQLGMRAFGRILADRLFPGAAQATLRDTLVDRWAENDPETYLASLSALCDWSVRERLPAIACPCLVITGDHDYTPVAYKEAYVRELPAGELVVIADSGHMTTHDQPQALNAAILRYLDRWAQASASR